MSGEPVTSGTQAAGPRDTYPNVLGSSTTFIFPARAGAGPAESEAMSREQRRGRRRSAEGMRAEPLTALREPQQQQEAGQPHRHRSPGRTVT